MFDYLFAQNSLPSLKCEKCNNRMYFHGGYYPTGIITCGNCGNKINMDKISIQFPNTEYDKDGHIVQKVTIVEKGE